MKPESELSLIFFIFEFTVITAAVTLYSFFYGKLTLSDILMLILAIVGAVHSVFGHFLKFPFFRQYPEDTEINKKKNAFISLVILIVSFAMVGVLVWGLWERL